MGYLTDKLGIKSVKGLEKYLQKHFVETGCIKVDLQCMKNPNGIRTFWAKDNKLHSFDLKNSFVIYVCQEEHLKELINAIEETLKKQTNENK